MKNVKACIDSYIANGYVKNIAVRVGIGDEIFCDIYNYDKSPINSKTMFDMASVTKIMATTSLALIAMDKNLLSIKDNVSIFRFFFNLNTQICRYVFCFDTIKKK